MLSKHFPLGGGLDLTSPAITMQPGRLLQGLNVEQKISGGYARVLGYTKFDANEVPGEGSLLGVWRYDGKVYAFRNATGGATAAMYYSTGSGWTLAKSGLTPSGSYEFVNANFAGTTKMYGVSGVHKGFEWDGTTWTDITTGMTTDTPDHLIAYKKHLFYTFGPSLQYSSTGNPASWTPLTGAGEIVVEEGISGLMQMSGGVLGVMGRNSTNLLQGSGSSDWINTALTEHGNRMGCIPGTLQQLGSRVKYIDDRGLTDFYASQNFGDFADAMVSYDVNEYLLTKKDSVSASCIVRNKSQYRLFFSDGDGMIFTFVGNKMTGATRIRFPHPVLHVASVEDDNGDEVIYFGSTDGYVRTMESGNGFDGTAITAYMRLAYNHLGNPRERKRFRRAVFDMAAGGTVNIQVRPDFRFDASGSDRSVVPTDLELTGGGSLLGEGLLGEFILGAGFIQEGQIDMPGHGGYVSLFFYSSSSTESQWEIDGVMFDYAHGRGRR